ncbi:MAG: amino acid ABC transporter ATP-binding protein [Bacteroidales bacterium]|nr:amino acid ABC transporter ATP-binding protein [Bacteroidales bacterium]
MITVSHLTKTFTHADGTAFHALDDISFHIDAGEVVSIIGPSGGGKSTLLRVLSLLERPNGGSILVQGEDILAPSYPQQRLRRQMGFVFQQFNLFPHLTVLGNITLPLTKVLGLSGSEARERALETLNHVALAEKADEHPNNLSGGQQQRAAIARTLAMGSRILLLDEPTSALDPTMVGEVQGVLRLLAKDGLTMLIVTHRMRLARDIASRTFFLHQGHLLEDDTPSNIFKHPKHTETQTFVQQIHSLRFDIATRRFDFYDMMSQIRQFCLRYALPEKMDPITHIVEEMLLLLGNYHSPVHIEVNHSELSGASSVVILHQGETLSPLERTDADELAVMIIRGMSSHIETDLTPNGVRLTFDI